MKEFKRYYDVWTYRFRIPQERVHLFFRDPYEVCSLDDPDDVISFTSFDEAKDHFDSLDVIPVKFDSFICTGSLYVFRSSDYCFDSELTEVENLYSGFQESTLIGVKYDFLEGSHAI